MKCFAVLALVFATAHAGGIAGGYGYGAAPALCAGTYNGYTGTSDPTTFIQCSNGIPNAQKCAYGTVWNQGTLTCEHTAGYAPGPAYGAGYGAPAGPAYSAGPAYGAGYGAPAAGYGGPAAGYGGPAAGYGGHGAGYGAPAAYGCDGSYDGLSGIDGAPTYTQCSNGIAYVQKCAYGTGWSNYSKRCE